ncbi:MAG TPA: ABC transporter ATP-binding protein, partial [Verrucomicrobiae bacterium]|nr:ABC transporter ATP-binding protein [Verrucomicrobiae bacterium]
YSAGRKPEMTVIKCSGVRKNYADHAALRGVNFEVSRNSCVGFLGPNGAGKTTTIRILTGLARPTAGQVEVAGIDVVKNPAGVRGFIGYLAQAPAFYNWMTGEEYLLFCGDIFKLPRRDARNRAQELLEITGLKGAARRKIGGYSGGMKQRLGIAQALINRPKVIFLDEPVSALDPIGRHEVLGMIRDLKQQATVFFSTHVLNDADQICDEVIILNEGEVALQAPVDEVRRSYALPEFEVEVDKFPEQLESELRGQAWYQAHSLDGKRLTISVKDLAAAKQGLLPFLLAQGVVIDRYEVQTPNLEQVFMRVVSNR